LFAPHPLSPKGRGCGANKNAQERGPLLTTLKERIIHYCSLGRRFFGLDNGVHCRGFSGNAFGLLHLT
jgi:hypothetical protein